MSWQGIEGHDAIVEQFRRGLERGRLASTFLFVGPAGVGKRSFALKLAQALLCQTNPEAALAPCGRCPSCVQVLAGTHPDLQLISKPKDKSVIPVEVFIGADDKRMQVGLCHDISLKPFMGGRKIAIIDDADFLAAEGANCLLKTLEEPPPRSVMILIGTSGDKQLPTIRSRCQIVRFQPLPAETVARLLVSQGIVEEADEARRLAQYSDGSLDRAAELASADLWTFRGQLLDALARPGFDNVQLAPVVAAFVEEAGKEAAARRARSRQAIGFALEFYRQLLRSLSGAAPSDDAELAAAVEQGQANWRGDEETAGQCLTRCLDALDHVDRNANQTTMLEAWLDDLAQITSARPLVPR